MYRENGWQGRAKKVRVCNAAMFHGRSQGVGEVIPNKAVKGAGGDSEAKPEKRLDKRPVILVISV
jgi:hypothetical protein